MIDLKYGIGDGFVKSLVDPFDFIVMNVKGRDAVLRRA